MIKVRFAASPTGYLDARRARLAVVSFLFARARGGRLLLRIDDGDAARSRVEYEAAIEQDLRWLGVAWDDFVRQSERLERYQAAAERLKASGRLYPCFEGEEELAAKRAMRVKRKLSPVYDRAMLALTPAQRAAAEANGKVPYWRFRLSGGAVAWDDMVSGWREVGLGAVSDPVLIGADGAILGGFASAVDDGEMAITHVIRDEDRVMESAVQMDMMAALGVAAPAFGHLPAMMEGDRSAKRGGVVSVRTFRRDGIEPRALAGYLARLGSRRDAAPLTLAELAADFEIGDFARGGARFDARQLLGLNRLVLHGLDYADVADRLPEGADAAFWMAVRGSLDMLSEARLWWAVVQGPIDAPDLPEAGGLLRVALDALPDEPWDEGTWKAWTMAISAATGVRGKALAMPLRLALTGEAHGPEMTGLLPLIGRARVVERLERMVG